MRSQNHFSIIVIFVMALSWLTPAAVNAAPALDTAASNAAWPVSRPLADYLNADGTLNLPAKGISGSLDPSGFQLISAAGEAPRFAPVKVAPRPFQTNFGVSDVNWTGFYNLLSPGTSALALAWTGTDLYIGGSFTTFMGCSGGDARCRYIVRWTPDTQTWTPLLAAGQTIGVGASVYALAWDSTNSVLYVGGSFSSVTGCIGGATYCTRIARWTPAASTWDPLVAAGRNSSANGTVRALAWTGTELYVGGSFTSITGCTGGDSLCGRVAKWTPAASTWNPLIAAGQTTGVNSGSVFALAWTGTDLYLGGSFITIPGCTGSNAYCTYVAQWIPATSAWDPLLAVGQTTNGDGTAYALAWTGTELYVGGEFTLVTGCSNGTDTSCGRLVKWTPGGVWSPLLSTGLSSANAAVNALAWTGTDLYVGGAFTSVSGCATASARCARAARWTPGSNLWNPLLVSGQTTSVNSTVNALAWTGTNLYVGGLFTYAAGCTLCTGVALWQPITPSTPVASWQGLSSVDWRRGATNGVVYALAWTGVDLYVGGSFTQVSTCVGGPTLCSRLAKWTPATGLWQPVVSSGQTVSANGTVLAFAWTGTELYIGGSFSAVNGCTAIPQRCARVAKWTPATKTWSPLLAAGYPSLDGNVRALAWTGTELYVGGGFTSANGCTGGNTRCANIAKWTPAASTWEPLLAGGSTSSADNDVYALVWDSANQVLYAGGGFSLVTGCTGGNTACARLARWTPATSAWDPLLAAGQTASIVGGTVFAFAWTGAELYVGGSFLSGVYGCTGGNANCAYVAKWTPATSLWDPLQVGVANNVRALFWDSAASDLYVGGDFTTVTGCTGAVGYCYGVAKWTPASSVWSPLSRGLNNLVRALAWDADSGYKSLYTGGDFTATRLSRAAQYLAQWRMAAVWDGGGADNNASTAANWSGDRVPDATDYAIFDRTSSKDALLNSAFSDVAGIEIDMDYGGTVTQMRSLAVDRLKMGGGTLVIADPASFSLTAEQVDIFGGTLQQTLPVSAANVVFLEIRDLASAIQYRAVEINTADDMGATLVSVSPVNRSRFQYCTDTFGSSPVYAGRCFVISPTTPVPATLTLWALDSERNSIPQASLAVFRALGSKVWAQFTSTNGVSGAYVYAQADAVNYGYFLIGQDGSSPTALARLDAHASALPQTGWLLASLAFLASFSAAWLLRRFWALLAAKE